MTDTLSTPRSMAARRIVLRTLGAGTVLLALGLAAAPDASAVSHSVPTPPIRMWPTIGPY